ncbi:PepSY-associated TM helix domain-containing protein [Alteromonas oceanisediminis]|uniref:PepSY-associated TM helix domain-containing protein n=1 Tax=Alteromonas oceanisediminis TaxID=2836180 RepID=UPI001BDA8D36|nr:PepSY domain-containing protein [Alteromonas oceanisediminis]MBT0586270.1 PepSY domain-containing protein [Alteromonas oceanisediminis]
MLKKNTLLNAWLWKWHVIAGLISLPFMALLAVTGSIYLFKDDVNHALYKETYFNQPRIHASASELAAPTLSLDAQLRAAQAAVDKPIVAVTLPSEQSLNTEFTVQGRGRASTNVYVDPYTGDVAGQLDQRQTLMYDVRKLHGELLLSTPGTLVIELVASWFLVLILTGLYVWWPSGGNGFAGLFTIRFSQGKRLFWRDLHAVMGFWMSAFLLIILAGGIPWTNVFGDQLKWVQHHTNTGYPQHWRSDKGIESVLPQDPRVSPLSLNAIARKAQQELVLPGTISIELPKTNASAFKVSNRAFYLRDQKVIYLDQYSGDIVKTLTWNDVGVLMDLRQVFMRLHQGEYGIINWSILLLVAVTFTLSTVAGLVSYLKRKPQNSWGIPRVPSRFRVDKVLVVMIGVLGLLFPLFGVSLVVIMLASATRRLKTLFTPSGKHNIPR